MVTLIVAGTTTEAILSYLPGVFMSICLSAGRLCQGDSDATMQDAVTNLKLVEIITMADLEDGCCPRKGAGSRGVESSEGALDPSPNPVTPLVYICFKSWIAVSQLV